MRNALVKEAIDFSEAAQELAPAAVLPAAQDGNAYDRNSRLPGSST